MTRKIQLQNYAVHEADAIRPPEDRFVYAVIMCGVFSLFIITYPYDDVYIPSWALAFIGLFVMAGLILSSWMHPEFYWASIAFCIYIPFSGEYPGDFNNLLMGVNMTNLLLIPVFVQWIMQRSRLNEPVVRFHAPDVPVIIFCVLSSMSVFRVGIESGGTDFLSQSIRVKRWLTPFVIYFLFVNTARNPQGVKYLVVTLATCVTAIAILTMKESYDIGPGGTWDAIRVRGVLGQANATGAFFVYYTLIFLGFFLCHWRDKRYWLLLIPFLMCGRAMTLANSRGGLIAFTLALLLTLWFRAKSLFVLGVLLVGLGLAFPQYLPETISGRLIYGTFQPLPHSDVISPDGEEFTDSEKSILHQMDASSQGRLAIWKAGFQLFLERPWFGHGYGEFPRRVGKYNPNVRMRDPHNTFLGIASEMGIFALMAFVVTLLLILRACHHVYHHARDGFMRSVGLAGVGMVMGVASANFFGSRLDTTELMAYFWILSAIILQYDRDLRAERRENGELTNRLVLDPWREQEENPAEPN